MQWYHIYLFTRIDSIMMLLALALVVSSITLVTCMAIHYDHYSEFKLPKKKWLIPYIVLCGVCFAMPSQKEVAAMYLLPKIVNNQDVQAIPADLAKLMRVKLDKWIEETVAPIKK